MSNNYCFQQIVTSSYTDLQDYTYYFVPAPWLCVKLLKLLQMYAAPGEISFRIVLYFVTSHVKTFLTVDCFRMDSCLYVVH